MAYMRLMGADSVAYHRATVLGRDDDHPGAALAYYASRGETPLRWGGSGAAGLGLLGAVTDSAYEAIYGPGGARHPVTGERLVNTLRPGMELVISAHKSVAELGVIGRAEDMHSIIDAERDATLAHLDELTRRRGGRRGRARTPSTTAGLIYAVTRHGTSRAADPCPHDHVLVANVVAMTGEAGGYKAPDTAAWRDDLHAATMVGRLAGARRAVELGYAIEADPGRSGRLRHWRIVGIPDEVCALHSKRSAEIDAAVAEYGVDSYRSRAVAARTTRAAKEHVGVAELVSHWQTELAEAGYPPMELAEAVTAAGRNYRVRGSLSSSEVDGMAEVALSPGGPIQTKVFRRADVIVALAPDLFGRPVEDLSRVVDTLLASPAAVPLLQIRGAQERHWAAAHTLVTEDAIAATVARAMAADRDALVPPELTRAAIATQEQRLGRVLTPGQRAAVEGICGNRNKAHLVVGLAGSGKTTALSCVREAYEAAGYRVLGTATAGQAARTLEADAGIPSRTLASMLWRIDHNGLRLSERDLVIIDEAGMTEDADLLRLLTAVEVAGAGVVIVGDDRQLGSVGPGGAMGALASRHGGTVHVLRDNVRQTDIFERRALGHLRSGDVGAAVSWYCGHGRIATAPTRSEVVAAMVEAWIADALAGQQVAMLAWQRANVAALNHEARKRWAVAGRLSGPEIQAPGGRLYAAGDRIVTLAPGAGGRLVTSERGEVVNVDPKTMSLVARMGDQRLVRLGGDELGIDRLDHAYATTVHRSQGMTVDVAHRLCDGGGRELAYVSMSRAQTRSTAWVVADTVDQAAEDLVRDWSHEQRPRWAIDTGTPDVAGRQPDNLGPVANPMDNTLARARLAVERHWLRAVLPPDPSDELLRVEHVLESLDSDVLDLETGHGRWTGTEIGALARDRVRIGAARYQAEELAGRAPFRTRHQWRSQARSLVSQERKADGRFAELAKPIRDRLATERAALTTTRDALVAQRDERERWLQRHPIVATRQRVLDSRGTALDMQVRLKSLDRKAPSHAAPRLRLRR